MTVINLPDGRYSLQIEFGAPEAGPYALELISTITRAAEIGCFGAVGLVSSQPAALRSDTMAEAEFQLVDAPRAMWRVLGGMVAFYTSQGLAIGPARLAGAGFALDPTQVEDRDEPPSKLPFRTRGELPEWGQPLCILVDFKQPVPESERTQLFDLFVLWSALVCGGYPAEGSPLGESGVSGIAVRVLEPQLLEFSAERCHLGDAALAPLLRGLSRLHATLELDVVETS